MSKLVINDLSENNELDKQALAEFNGGINTSALLARIKAAASSSHTLDQEPELGVSPDLSGIEALANQPFTPHS